MLSLRDNLRTSRVLRRVALPLLAHLNPGDITILHHWTGDPVRLHAYHHKGYWFLGRDRENDVMSAMWRILEPRDTVFELGGHIGYVTLFLRHIVTPGQVHVFEPGPNNLKYLRANAEGKPGVRVVPSAAGAEDGTATLHVDNLSGQNSSLIPDFEGFRRTARRAFDRRAGTTRFEVPLIKLDTYARGAGLVPDFIKVDVEGAELSALRGASELLAGARPVLMVEILAHRDEIHGLLGDLGYAAYGSDGGPVHDELFSTNTFFLHPEVHAERLSRLRGD